jgi:succinate dehydrogenase/fumarate reductase iron-sulfur protein
MKVTFKIRRLDPSRSGEPWYQEYPVDVPDGMVVLYALHEIHDRQDGTLAYRYSCRGAICGSCAMRVNGTAALACKTQVSAIAKPGDTITLEPLMNLSVIKDLVVNQGPFFAEVRKTHYHLIAEHERELDAPIQYGEGLSAPELDQWHRSSDCIKCQACFSDCPKRKEDPNFIGPEACVDLYRYRFDPRDGGTDERMAFATAPGGIWNCDKHAVCVKVCPKDCRPMRAIMMLRRRAEKDNETS